METAADVPVTEVFPYPPNTVASDPNATRYYHHLSPENQAALNAVKKFISDNSIDVKSLCRYYLLEDLVLLRYLRANNMNVDKSITHIKNNIDYRKEMNIDELMTKQPHEILGSPLTEFIKHVRHWQYGFDKIGRPVLYKQYCHLDAPALKKIIPFDNLLKYHLWEQEVCLKLSYDQALKTNTIIETVTFIVDLKDMKLSQVNRDFLNFLRLIGQVDASQYPETLGRIFIINAPSAFPMVWKLVKMWLDPVVAQKIFILGGPNDWRPKVFDFIGEENMPSTYGGKQPALHPDSHPYAIYMATHSGNSNLDYWNSKEWQSG